MCLLPTMLASTSARLTRFVRAVHTEKKLTELGITLPPVVAPVANYKSVVRSGNLLFTGTGCVWFARCVSVHGWRCVVAVFDVSRVRRVVGQQRGTCRKKRMARCTQARSVGI